MVGELVGELHAVMQVPGSDPLVGADPEHHRPARHPAAGGDQVLVGVDVEALVERHLEKLVPSGDELAPLAQRGAANQLDAPGFPDNGVVGVLAIDALVEQRPGLGALVRAREPEEVWLAHAGRQRVRAAGAKPLDRGAHVGAD